MKNARPLKMESCEICAKKDYLINAVIEGSIVKVCQTCSKFGNVIETRNENNKVKTHIIDEVKQEQNLILNYSKIIKQARTIMNLTQADLARKINEKESLIRKIESKHLVPTEDVIKKLEAFLRVELTIKEESDYKKKSRDNVKTAMTIGDLFKKKDE